MGRGGEMKIKSLEKYLGIVSLILIIAMIVGFGISIYNLGSGIRPRLERIERDVSFLVNEDTENKTTQYRIQRYTEGIHVLLAAHVHARTENNKAVFKN